MSRMNQHDRIIQYMKDFGSITTFRISEMRRDGMEIIGKSEAVKNRYGDKCHIHRYTLKEEA